MVFIDTNIFVYAHDESDLKKTQMARSLLIHVTENQEGRISTQVIQEFCNVALKKSAVPLKAEQVRNIVRVLMDPLLHHQPDSDFYLRALTIFEKYSVSFYDALIIQAAIDMNCSLLYSEDLQAGAKYGTVKVINPFD